VKPFKFPPRYKLFLTVGILSLSGLLLFGDLSFHIFLNSKPTQFKPYPDLKFTKPIKTRIDIPKNTSQIQPRQLLELARIEPVKIRKDFKAGNVEVTGQIARENYPVDVLTKISDPSMLTKTEESPTILKDNKSEILTLSNDGKIFTTTNPNGNVIVSTISEDGTISTTKMANDEVLVSTESVDGMISTAKMPNSGILVSEDNSITFLPNEAFSFSNEGTFIPIPKGAGISPDGLVRPLTDENGNDFPLSSVK